jgi:hypothetical protein
VSDTLGQYRLDSLPAGTYPITFSCYGKGLFAGGGGDSPPVRLESEDTVRLDYQFGGGSCDLRPERVLHALFTGFYSSGFEQSDFLFCADSPWFADADTVGMGPVQRTALVVRPRDGKFRGEPTKWPKPRLVYPPWDYPEYFIRWTGRLKGPGRYGHMGVSMFELTVDSIVEVRTPRSSDCRGGASGRSSQ